MRSFVSLEVFDNPETRVATLVSEEFPVMTYTNQPDTFRLT